MAPPSAILTRLETLTALAPAGFAMALHVRYTTPRYLFQTYPVDWISHYNKAGMVMHDPTVLWGFENTGLIQWDALLADDTHGVMAEAAQHGMKFGITYVIDRADSRSLTSFSRGDRGFDTAEIDAIQTHVDAIHDATAALEQWPADSRDELHRLSITLTHP